MTLPARVTIERSLDEATRERFLELYHESFAPLAPLAAARQSFTDDEFRMEADHPDVLKVVGWRGDDIVALALISTNLDVVPWISPEFFKQQYPDQYARRAIFYYSTLLVVPEERGGPWVHAITEAGALMTATHDGLVAFDCCRFTKDEVQLPEMIYAISNMYAVVEPVEIDVQHYYAYVTRGIREIDLRDKKSHGVDISLEARGELPTSTGASSASSTDANLTSRGRGAGS
ncbi:MAG: uncharacterized protein JWN46_3401 [Acidimicrobiales bacterium]|nr:uncharacterized protein [Acidimicrobiales bacterium]